MPNSSYIPDVPDPQDLAILFKVACTLLQDGGGERAYGELLSGVLDLSIEALHADRGMVVVPENGAFRATVARNIRSESLDKTEAELSTSIAGAVLDQRHAVLLGNAAESGDFQQNPSVKRMALRSVLCAPLITGDQVFALIYLENRSIENCFTERHRNLLDQICALAAPRLRAAVAVESSRSYARELGALVGERDLITADASMAAVLATVKQVAITELPVLIQGETGTGKELIARSLYRQSRRSNASFVVVNCAAIPADLMEAELFGYLRGAFTGATHDRVGLIGTAHRGTLFLDEIGELPLALQPKLLRVLQSGEVLRLGSTRTEIYDVRIVSASNRDLLREVEEGGFRDDLFYRLAGAVVTLPPLRERPHDIHLLADHFLRLYAARYHRPLPRWSGEALAVLSKYSFPGNVRELESECARLVAMLTAGCEEITVESLSARIRGAATQVSSASVATAPSANAAETETGMGSVLPAMSLAEMEKRLIATVLEHTEGNRTHAAEVLGISREGLRTKMQRYGMSAKE